MITMNTHLEEHFSPKITMARGWGDVETLGPNTFRVTFSKATQATIPQGTHQSSGNTNTYGLLPWHLQIYGIGNPAA